MLTKNAQIFDKNSKAQVFKLRFPAAPMACKIEREYNCPMSHY